MYFLKALALSGNSAAIELLLAHSADVNSRGEQDMTPLHWATMKGDVKSVELLLASKPDLNARNQFGETPLHFAVRGGWKQTTELLLARGADTNVRNNEGKTPLDATKETTVLAMNPSRPAGGEAWTKPSELAPLLRKHGALDDLPDFKSIGVSRASSGFRATAFTVGSNDWSRFTMMELIAWQLSLISTAQIGFPPSIRQDRLILWGHHSIRFPDLSRITIHRPAKDSKNRKQIPVNLTEAFQTNGEKGDVMLQPGDVVEIPEADHPVSDSWSGPVGKDLEALVQATARTVTLIVGGKTNELRLATLAGPQFRGAQPSSVEERIEIKPASFMIQAALDQSKLVRFSSDLTRVKVSRKVGPNGKPAQWLVDCSGAGGTFPDLWLLHGDVIEVPDKP